MAVTYGFFNSVNGDRKYNAEQMSEYFRGIINEGVYQHLDGGLAVTAGTGLAVNVAAGRAIIQNRWVQNSAAMSLTIAAASETYARKDAVVIRLNWSSRAISIAVKTGTPAASPVAPSMTRNSTTYEMALAYVNVAANATSVTVTDKRSDSTVCGWVTVAQSTSGEVDAQLNAMKTGFDGVEYDSPAEMVQSEDAKIQASVDTVVPANLAGDVLDYFPLPIPVVNNMWLTVSTKDGSLLKDAEANPPSVILYDENKNVIASFSTNVNASYRTVQITSLSDNVAYYIGYSHAPVIQYMLNYGKAVLPWQEYFWPVRTQISNLATAQSQTTANLTKRFNADVAGFGYSGGAISTEVRSDGYIVLYFQLKMGYNYPSRNTTQPQYDEWSTIASEIPAANKTIDGNHATFLIPPYRYFTFNVTTNKLYIRTSAQLAIDDVILLSNVSSYLPQGYLVNYENYRLRVTNTDIEKKAFNSAFNPDVIDFQTKCTEFCEKLVDVETAESFLFFTDPHVLNEAYFDNDPIYMQECITYIQKFNNSAPVAFCLCGGDWLENGDTVAEAAFKMGYIKQIMKSMFKPSYLLVGNHDTNYQGVEKLSIDTIDNLWYEGKKSYFTFEGMNTKFYCFNTDVEASSLSDLDNEQIGWFLQSLTSETAGRIALAAHILYNTSGGSLHPLSNAVLAIAEQYNSRGTYTFGGQTYDFSSATGTIYFFIGGHTHEDATYVINGIRCVLTRNARRGANPPYAFDLVAVDYDTNKINLVRVGNGESRTLDM